MQRAEPNEYFKRREQRFNIAHKYGFHQTDYHFYLTDCGIAFTDEPILLVAYTDNSPKAYDVLADYCSLMCDYAQYHHALRLKEESETAEPSPTPAAEDLPGTLSVPSPGPEAEQPEESAPPAGQSAEAGSGNPGFGKASFYAIGGILMALLFACILLAVIGGAFRVRRGFFTALAVLLCLAAIGRVLWPIYQQLREKPSGDPQETVQIFFAALAREDYEQAYACLDGVESLGLEYIPQRQSGRAIRDAMHAQFSAELYGSCNIGGERAYQQINCRYLDLDKLENDAGSQALRIISLYGSTHPLGDLYNEKGNYRQELMLESWYQAVLELLQQSENYRSSGGVQLELRWRDGQWRIAPTERLLQMLTGGLSTTERGGEA